MEPPTLPESVSLNNGLLSSTIGFLRSTFYRVLFIACHIISFPCVKPFKGFPVYSELKLLTITFKTPHEFPWLLLSLLISCQWVSCSSNSGPFAVPHIFSKLPLPQCLKCYSLCLEYSSLSFLPIISSPLFSSVQSLTRVGLFATLWIAACQASLSITSSRSLLKLMSIESVMTSSHLILCCPLLLLPTIPPSIRVFSNESTLHVRWPKYWSFSFSISPSNEHPGLISFRMDW